MYCSKRAARLDVMRQARAEAMQPLAGSHAGWLSWLTVTRQLGTHWPVVCCELSPPQALHGMKQQAVYSQLALAGLR